MITFTARLSRTTLFDALTVLELGPARRAGRRCGGRGRLRRASAFGGGSGRAAHRARGGFPFGRRRPGAQVLRSAVISFRTSVLEGDRRVGAHVERVHGRRRAYDAGRGDRLAQGRLRVVLVGKTTKTADNGFSYLFVFIFHLCDLARFLTPEHRTTCSNRAPGST